MKNIIIDEPNKMVVYRKKGWSLFLPICLAFNAIPSGFMLCRHLIRGDESNGLLIMLLLAFTVIGYMLNMAIYLPIVLKVINNEPLIEIDSEGFLLNTLFFINSKIRWEHITELKRTLSSSGITKSITLTLSIRDCYKPAISPMMKVLRRRSLARGFISITVHQMNADLAGCYETIDEYRRAAIATKTVIF